jgi:amino-acid N-acetyltransferase
VITCRKAEKKDIDSMFELIESYADKGIMLPRSRKILLKQLDTFVVAVEEDKVIGCGSLMQLGDDLVEIRSLGVAEDKKGRGIGRRLVESLLEEASRQRIPKVMALTYEVPFFLRSGFYIVSKEIFPGKVWTDCIHCKKQHCCDEIAVLKQLD